MKESSTTEVFKRKPGRPKAGSPVPPPVLKGKVGRPAREEPLVAIDNISRPESLNVVFRFFEVVDYLIGEKTIKSMYHLSTLMSTNRNQFTRLKQDPTKHSIPVYFLWYFCTQFGVSADWILTGRGKMFPEESK